MEFGNSRTKLSGATTVNIIISSKNVNLFLYRPEEAHRGPGSGGSQKF
jgi:hypothetical protein